jgi:hypothetical protein
VYNSKKTLYLSRIVAIQPVDKNVDNPGFPVDELWISVELSTGLSCPQFYPQVYPQITPLLSTIHPQVFIDANVTTCLNSSFFAVFIHSLEELSTTSVDKWTWLWKISDDLSTRRRLPVDRLWTEYAFDAYFVLQSPIPRGGGSGSPFALDLVGDLMYLGEDVAVAVYEVGDLCSGVHNGGMVASAEGLPYLG